MKRIILNRSTLILIISFFLQPTFLILAQDAPKKTEIYENAKKWKFGGDLGLGFGSGYTEVRIAPSAIYEINPYLYTGISLQGSYIKNNSKGNYTYNFSYDSWIYGASIIALSNPIKELQLSIEFEQLKVNNSYKNYDQDIPFKERHDFWNTAIFLGIGYSAGPATIGIRYNVLYKEKDLVYASAYMPFIRMYF